MGRWLPGALAAVGAAAILLWFHAKPTEGLARRVPGADRPPGASDSVAVDIAAAGTLTTGDGTPAPLPGSWPGFRGERRDGISRETIPLARAWGVKGPPALWSIEVGEGYAGPAVRDGRVFLLDYDRASKADVLRCLSLADAKPIWRFAYPVKIKRYHGFSRTIPAVTERHVVSLGPKCHVVCLESATGRYRWSLDLVRAHGATVPQWYAGQCPLVDAGRVVLGVGGPEALVMAVDRETGAVVWKTPNPGRWTMTHSSVVSMEFGGRRTYVYCASGGVAGVSADDGARLWETREWVVDMATVPSPVVVGDDRLFLSGGYNAGGLMLRLKESGGAVVPEILYRLKPSIFGSTQQTPILFEDRLFGVRPDGQLTCLDLDGKVKWTSGSEHRFGLGPYAIAGGRIYALNDSGWLALVEADPERFKLVAKAQVLHGQEAWGPMAVAGGRLLARDLTRLVCLDIAGQ